MVILHVPYGSLRPGGKVLFTFAPRVSTAHCRFSINLCGINQRISFLSYLDVASKTMLLPNPNTLQALSLHHWKVTFRFWSPQAKIEWKEWYHWPQISALSLICCVTLGKLLNLSELPFLLGSRDIIGDTVCDLRIKWKYSACTWHGPALSIH